MTASTATLDQKISAILETKVAGNIPPLTLKRMTVEEISLALEESVETIQEQVSEMVQKTATQREHPRAFAYFLRKHHDGRYSYSARSPFESLYTPDPFEIERLLAVRSFDQLDALLAATKLPSPKLAADAPKLSWADGLPFSQAASDWYIGQMLAKTFYIQQTASDQKKAVAEAHDLLRDALSDGSARELVTWLLEKPFPKGLRLQLPRHSASFEEIAERYLKPVKELPPFAVDGMLTAGVLGTRYLLRYGLIGADKRLDYVHEAWPKAEDVSGTEAEWRACMQTFLERAIKLGTRFPAPIFERYYLSNPIMATLLTEATFEVIGTKAIDADLDKGRFARAVTMQEQIRILGLKAHKPKIFCETAFPLPKIPSDPMSIPEYYRRCKTAGLQHFKTHSGLPYAFVSDSNGSLYIYPLAVAPGSARKPVRIDRVELKRSVYESFAELGEGVSEGWDTLDPAWRRVFDEKMEILLSPSPLVLPKLKDKTDGLSVDSRARVVSGELKGKEGLIYKLAPSQSGDGLRAGIEDKDGEKHWLDAADLERIDSGQWTALHAACDAYDVELVDAILEASDVWLNTETSADDVQESAYHTNLRYFGNSTPLHVAAAQDAPEIVKRLLDKGANPNVQDVYGNTPLHVADKAKEVIDLLIKAGADTRLTNEGGDLPQGI